MNTKHNGHVNINIDLARMGAPGYLSKKIQKGIDDGYTSFKIRSINPDCGVYPNICVPISGIIDYYRQKYNCHIFGSKDFINQTVLVRSHLLNPLEINKTSEKLGLNRVWKFNADTHQAVIDILMDSFRQSSVMGKDILLGLELALNEVTDNIIQHSLPSPQDPDAYGFVMGQYHKSQKEIAVAVFDTGQGVQASLAKGGKEISDPKEALKYALEKGTTDGNGAGNGLWMMSRIVSAASGRFELASDGVSYSKKNNNNEGIEQIKRKRAFKPGTTFIDFQITSTLDISLPDILERDAPTNLWAENHLDDTSENLTVKAIEESKGFRSRYEARAFANIILNLIKNNDKSCNIDFTEATVLSASYADELIVTLLESLGFIGFIKKVNLTGLNKVSCLIFDECMDNRFRR